MCDLCTHDAAGERVTERQRERGAERLGIWFHPWRLGQEAASMLGNEVTGQSVNTHWSLWPWPGGRLSHCSENGNVNKINLPAFWPLCGSIGWASPHSRTRIWRVPRKSTQTLQYTNKHPNCVSTLFIEAQKHRGRLVKIHSSLVVLLLKFGS